MDQYLINLDNNYGNRRKKQDQGMLTNATQREVF